MWRGVADDDERAAESVDIRGIALLSSAIVVILLALDLGTSHGFTDPLVMALLIAGVILMPTFVIVERGVGSIALVPQRIMHSREFIGPLYSVLGARAEVSVGAACLTAGVVLVAFAIGSTYAALVPGLVIVGIGVGMFFSAITTVAVTAVDADDASLAGGIIYMGNVAGGSIGIGLNTAIVLAASELADGIRTAYLIDAALGLVGVVCAVLHVRGDGARWHPLHRLHHRAHG